MSTQPQQPPVRIYSANVVAPGIPLTTDIRIVDNTKGDRQSVVSWLYGSITTVAGGAILSLTLCDQTAATPTTGKSVPLVTFGLNAVKGYTLPFVRCLVQPDATVDPPSGVLYGVDPIYVPPFHYLNLRMLSGVGGQLSVSGMIWELPWPGETAKFLI